MQHGVSGGGGNTRGGGVGGPEADNALLSLEATLLNACETLAEVASIGVNFNFDKQDLLFSKVYVVSIDTHTHKPVCLA